MSLSIFIGDAAAGPVLAALEMQKWRVARERAKDLCKRDRARYLPLLVESNLGLVRDLISRNLLSDARTVLDYLKTIASVEVVAALEGEIAKAAAGVMSAANPVAGHQGAAITRLWPELLRIASDQVSGQELRQRDIASIDDVVTSFTHPPDIPGDEISQRLAAELKSILSACQATSEGRWDDATEFLRHISGRSIFRHWRLFLRGLRLFMQGSQLTGKECFDRLPVGSACALAAASIMGGPAAIPIRASARAAWNLAMAGQPIEWAADIAASDAAWQKGEWTSAKDFLSKGLGDSFPSRGHGLPGYLTETLLHVGPPQDAPSTRRNRQLSIFWEKLCRTERPNRLWLAACSRYLLVADETTMSPEALTQEVGDLLRLESEIGQQNLIRDSQGWQWLGEKLLKKQPSSFFHFGRNPEAPRDLPGAIRAFEAAKKSDPDNEAAWLGLLAAYEEQEDKSKRNRLLDEMVARFPDNKNVLVRAGALAVERGAFSKGIGYLELASALDPLDPFVRSQKLIAFVQLVRDAHRKGKETAEVWHSIEPLLDPAPGCEDLMRAKWAMRVRRSLLDPANAQAARAEAECLAPSQLEFLAFECLLSTTYGTPLGNGWQQAWRSSPPVTWAVVCGVVHIISFLTHLPEFEKKTKTRADEVLSEVVNRAARQGLFLTDPSGARALFERLRREDHSGRRSQSMFSKRSAELMFRIVRQLPHKAVRSDLTLRLLDLELRECFDSTANGAANKKAIRAFISDAEKADASHHADAARKILANYQEDWDFEIDEKEEEDKDDDCFASDFPTGGAIASMVADYISASRLGDAKRMKEIERTMKEFGLPLPPGARPEKPAKSPAKNSVLSKPKPAGDLQNEFGFSSTP